MNVAECTPGHLVMVHNRYFATIWAKWEQVGQHRRTWYLTRVVDPQDRLLEVDLVPDYAVEFTDVIDPGLPSATFTPLPGEFSQHLVVDEDDERTAHGPTAWSPSRPLTDASTGGAWALMEWATPGGSCPSPRSSSSRRATSVRTSPTDSRAS